MKGFNIPLIVKKIRQSLAIVENGSTASRNIAVGKYVLWKGDLYTVKTAITSGDTLSSTNLDSVSDGGLNSLSSKTWTKFFEKTNAGNSAHNITIPENASEIFALIKYSPSGVGLIGCANVPKAILPQTGTIIIYFGGGYVASAYYNRISLEISLTTARINDASTNGTSYANTATIELWSK